MKKIWILLVPFWVMSSVCLGGEANVLEVTFEKRKDGSLDVHATVQHDDEGWEHYADRWEILDMEGTLLDTRVLMHPHSHEPFTRSISRAKIPSQIKKIRLRAHDSVHGYGEKEVVVEIPEP